MQDFGFTLATDGQRATEVLFYEKNIWGEHLQRAGS